MSRPALPYCLESWFPALSSPLVKPVVLGVEESATRKALVHAWLRLPPGKALVIVERARGALERVGRLVRPPLLERWVRGLPEVGRHHQWFVLPGAGESQVLLPPDRDGFAAGLPLLPSGRRRARLGRRMLERGWRRRLTRSLGLAELHVVIKGRAGAAEIPWIGEVEATSFAIALGVPGPHRKAVARVVDRWGMARGVVKLSLTKRARRRILREARTLALLGRNTPEGTFGPSFIAHGEGKHASWLIQEDIAGGHSGNRFGSEHLAFLVALRWHTQCQVPFEDLRIFRAASTRLEALKGDVDGEWHATFTALRDALSSRLAGSSIPCCMAHGDFTPWNIALRKGHLRAFDWEQALMEAPALFDLVHFQVQTGILQRHSSPRRIWAELSEILDHPGWTPTAEEGDATEDLAAQAALYLLHVATFDEQLHRNEDPLFDQANELRRERMALARLIERRLRDEEDESEPIAA